MNTATWGPALLRQTAFYSGMNEIGRFTFGATEKDKGDYPGYLGPPSAIAIILNL